ncbi:MAG: nucleotide-binding protein [Azoarcus sp.]|jgi:predicted nucleotide-binding protein|nr:nucleotide-binding protein [Azoarcus sp.]
MSNNKELAPPEGGPVPTIAYSDDGNDGNHPTALDQMFALFNQAQMLFQLQRIQELDSVARAAEALHSTSKEASANDRVKLEQAKNLISLFGTLAKVMAFQTEGRFDKARQETGKALTMVSDNLATIKKYERLPSIDKETILEFKALYRVYATLFKGLDAHIQAEVVAYQGNMIGYIELLRKAVTEYRKANRTPLTEIESALIGSCNTNAERLETRIEIFSSQKAPRYLPSNGNKIFIIHGHDEGKWRELRSLLETDLHQKTTVLKEEPGAGEALIKKFEDFANDCCYAFALITPDDFIKKGGKTYFQARPNVLFELGWFYGRFGRDRVCIVKKASTEMPSDLAGIMSIDFHDDVSEGFTKIQAELRRAGLIGEGNSKRPRSPAKRTKKQRPIDT